MNPRKVLLIIIDGMGDRPVWSQGNRTPLEAARTPNLDRMAAEGSLGMMDPIAPGIRPGSDVATMNLLGYDPYKYYEGRGGLEALGAGLDVRPGDVAFRCNFATVDDDLRVIDRRAGRIQKGTKDLAESVSKIKLPGVKVVFKETVSHRAVLILRGKGLSRQVSDVDPHMVGVKVSRSDPVDKTAAAKKTAAIVNQFVKKSYELLRSHQVNQARRAQNQLPANIILPRGAGSVPRVRTLKNSHGIEGVAIGAVALFRGVSRLAGLELIDVPGATGGLDTDFDAKARAAIRALEQADYVLLHLKGADVAGHDGNFDAKARFIEQTDMRIGTIRKQLAETTHVVVTADHSTPIETRDHSGDPVPLLIWGPGALPNGAAGFNEKNASHGNMGRLRGAHLMPMIIDLLGKAEKFGF